MVALPQSQYLLSILRVIFSKVQHEAESQPHQRKDLKRRHLGHRPSTADARQIPPHSLQRDPNPSPANTLASIRNMSRASLFGGRRTYRLVKRTNLVPTMKKRQTHEAKHWHPGFRVPEVEHGNEP